MKIAQVSPLFESVPPRTYGGTERIVHYLTEELVHQGHEVTLFASGDSQTSAELRSVTPEALRLGNKCRDVMTWHTLQLATVAQEAEDYDIIHFHTDFFHFPLWRQMYVPQVTTLHGRLDLPDLPAVYTEFQDMSVISISDSQRLPLPMAYWAGTVYNGTPKDLYDFESKAGSYFAFLGRISPEKGVEVAIKIALQTGVPLKIAAKIDSFDQPYFDTCIRRQLEHPLIEYIGEVNEHEKNELLGGALALLFPIDWPEPFGLVMIEAMACGTPVIAYRHGSVPEVMADGVTGYIVANLDEALAAVERIEAIDRRACRRHFENYFTAQHMAEDYLQIYDAQTDPHIASHLAVG
ncbi:glycosyltransferase family 4 protein [Pseudomonadota bacterium]